MMMMAMAKKRLMLKCAILKIAATCMSYTYQIFSLCSLFSSEKKKPGAVEAAAGKRSLNTFSFFFK